MELSGFSVLLFIDTAYAGYFHLRYASIGGCLIKSGFPSHTLLFAQHYQAKVSLCRLPFNNSWGNCLNY